jgi:putative tricarboxylic transport membrane protein
MAMGLFGISEVLLSIEGSKEVSVFKTKAKNILPNLQDWKRSAFPIVRGSVLGFFLGVVPGGGAILASFASYAVEKRVSKHPEEFGKGAIEGVASPETANNAAVGGAFIPLFALGIPTNAIMAILLVNFMIHGLAPGPKFIAQHPEIYWGIVASMYIGNILLIVLNVPLIGIWIRLLRVPYTLLSTLIFLFCVVGVYSTNCSIFDILVMIIFGLMGYVFKKFGYPIAPVIFAFVLGPMLEVNFRRAMIISSHDFSFIFTRPIACGAILISIFLLSSGLYGHLRKSRRKVIESGMLERE